ncbi:hypothetical protein TanjilG_16051 [Lupinus angustifolius]|uniref:Uncharacterized protein n=1 Tax=Lupinus angustifolius TaxID=3871 RepID=A0A4P1RH87_LUPAN|nr:hypothetical protein TanjilG_16051 [Lupinus angustifolius]
MVFPSISDCDQNNLMHATGFQSNSSALLFQAVTTLHASQLVIGISTNATQILYVIVMTT